MKSMPVSPTCTSRSQRRPGRRAQPALLSEDWLRNPRVLGVVTLTVLLLVGSYLIPLPRVTPDFRNPAQVGIGRSADADDVPTSTQWKDLMPAPSPRQQQMLAKLRAGQMLSDDDPRAEELYAELRAVWETAPANPAVAGIEVRIPGYVVPLERHGDRTPEFLLVPYYGACIHAPPPPANQVIHVVAGGASKALRSMDAVWVKGKLLLEASDGQIAARYRIEGAEVLPY